MHVWHLFAPQLDVANRAIKALGRWLDRVPFAADQDR